MKNYKVILKTIQVIDVKANSEEEATQKIKNQLPPRELAEIQVAEEAEVKE